MSFVIMIERTWGVDGVPMKIDKPFVTSGCYASSNLNFVFLVKIIHLLQVVKTGLNLNQAMCSQRELLFPNTILPSSA